MSKRFGMFLQIFVILILLGGSFFRVANAFEFNPEKPWITRQGDSSETNIRDYESVDRFKGDLRLKFVDLSINIDQSSVVKLIREYSSSEGSGVIDVDGLGANYPNPYTTPGGEWRISAMPEIRVLLQDKVDGPVYAQGGNPRYVLGAQGYRDMLCGTVAPQQDGRPLTIHAHLFVPGNSLSVLASIGSGIWQSASNWLLKCESGSSGSALGLTIYSPDGDRYELGAIEPPNSMRLSTNWLATKRIARGGAVVSISYRTFLLSDFGYASSEVAYVKPLKIADGLGTIMQFEYQFSPLRNMDGYPTTSEPAITKVTYPAGVISYEYNPLESDTKNISGSTMSPLTWKNRKFPLKSVSYSSGNYKWEFEYGLPWVAYSAMGDQRGTARIVAIKEPTGGRIDYTWDLAPVSISMLDRNWVGCPISQCPDIAKSIYMSSTATNGRIASRVTSDGGRQVFSYTRGISPESLDVSDVAMYQDGKIIGYSHAEFFGNAYFSARAISDNSVQVIQTYPPVVDKGWMLGLTKKFDLLDANKSSIDSRVYSYLPNQIGAGVRWIIGPTWFKDASVFQPLISSVVHIRNGATYSTSYSNYDSYGNPGAVIEAGPNGGTRTTTLTYLNDTSKWIIGKVKNETFPGGSTVRNFDANGNLLSLNRDGVVTSYTYDSAGNVATKNLPRGLVHNYSSYKRGVPQVESQPEGINISRVVDDAGRMTSETNGDNRVTMYAYDELDRVTSITYPTGNPKTVVYTTTSKTATRGSLVETTLYDGFGRPTSITLGGIAINSTHDGLGRKTFESNPGAATGTSYQYDMLSRVTRVTNADGSYQTHAYGASTNSVTDERGNTTTYAFRSYGDPSKQFLMSVTAPVAAANQTLTRNAVDLVTSVTQGAYTRTYGYDARYYLTSIVNPETGATIYERDDAGNMLSRQVGTSGKTLYSYDNQNRLKAVTYPGATPATAFTYSKTHKMLTANSSVASRSYSYDANDNLISESLSLDGYVFSAGYGYNGNDQIISTTYPRSNRVVNYVPDVLGRPSQASGYISSVTYWPSGLVKQVNYANDTVSSYSQNTRLWPSSFSTQKTGGATYFNSSYSYDGMGNLTSIGDSVDSNYIRSMGYDPMNRMNVINGPWGIGTVAYSSVGNIVNMTLGSSYGLHYDYDANNRMVSTTGVKASSYTYDAYGNVASSASSTFSYDDVPNLRCVNCSNTANKIEYAYDAMGKRVWVAKGGVKSYEMSSSNGNTLIEFVPSAANKLTEYVYLGGKRVAQRVSP